MGASVVGCKSTQQRLQESIQHAFEEDTNAGNILCGFPVLGLSNISVSGVNHTGSNSAGTGTANVTATPRTIPGMGNSTATCSGTVAYAYDTLTNTSRNFRGRRTTTSTFRVYNITVTSRAGAPANAMANMGGMGNMGNMPGMPGMTGMPGMGMPGMGATGGRGGTAAQGAIMPTQVGMIVPGVLTTGDTVTSQGGMADDYQIQLMAGQPVTIVVRGGGSMTSPGSNLDVYTVLMQNGVELTHDDDSAGNFNSRILFTPPTTGTYVIRVTTFSAGQQGSYTLQTWPGLNPLAQ